ncbi:MAG: HEPN domain-containing protein [Planctomycetes bacterium]|nr:HEPN domain-containing protein [Planctomycetota bacterium]
MRALQTADLLAADDPDGAASRAYYAAFHAVSALLAQEGRSFAKHSAVESAVHRDLVKTGRWPVEAGTAYTWLASLRSKADYGGKSHVTREEALEAVRRARRILHEACRVSPEPWPEAPPREPPAE